MTDQPQPVDFSNWMPDGFPDFQRGVPRKRVDILTASESSLFGPWSDAWISQAMRTDSADWDTFDAAVRECYRLAGLEPPKIRSESAVYSRSARRALYGAFGVARP
jgi:hypothetical protein